MTPRGTNLQPRDLAGEDWSQVNALMTTLQSLASETPAEGQAHQHQQDSLAQTIMESPI